MSRTRLFAYCLCFFAVVGIGTLLIPQSEAKANIDSNAEAWSMVEKALLSVPAPEDDPEFEQEDVQPPSMFYDWAQTYTMSNADGYCSAEFVDFYYDDYTFDSFTLPSGWEAYVMFIGSNDDNAPEEGDDVLLLEVSLFHDTMLSEDPEEPCLWEKYQENCYFGSPFYFGGQVFYPVTNPNCSWTEAGDGVPYLVLKWDELTLGEICASIQAVPVELDIFCPATAIGITLCTENICPTTQTQIKNGRVTIYFPTGYGMDVPWASKSHCIGQ